MSFHIARTLYLRVEKPVLTVTPLVLNQDTFPRPLAFLKPRDEEREVSRESVSTLELEREVLSYDLRSYYFSPEWTGH